MTNEELQNQKQEQEAMKIAKEEAKKQAKKQIKKIVWNAIKTAIIPMLLMLVKILAVSLLVCAIVSLFTITIGDGGGGGESQSTSTEEIYDSAIAGDNAGADITSTTLQVQETEIQNFINNYESENTTLKTEMIEKTSQILQWQETHGYSAYFLITVAFEEAESVENFNFDTFFNDINERSKIWNTNGYNTIQLIAEAYIADETANEWANNIANKMYQYISSSTN